MTAGTGEVIVEVKKASLTGSMAGHQHVGIFQQTGAARGEALGCTLRLQQVRRQRTHRAARSLDLCRPDSCQVSLAASRGAEDRQDRCWPFRPPIQPSHGIPIAVGDQEIVPAHGRSLIEIQTELLSHYEEEPGSPLVPRRRRVGPRYSGLAR